MHKISISIERLSSSGFIGGWSWGHDTVLLAEYAKDEQGRVRVFPDEVAAQVAAQELATKRLKEWERDLD